ncbi:hypothetical protein [Wolbachia endosymbiont of Cimex lectularius]|uniref:hypothetical protein n=1 Tax=Wolbachia endosymbiont of Cimex lectularius TaxID=246273 RepID=UPI001E28B436|nr:hypothetical protein [Wolbachia endosymbiont of Cimex lectularius]
MLLCVMVLPSFFLLAKIAIGLITIAIATISMKTLLKATSNTSEEKKTDQNQVAQQTTRSKIAVGLTSIFALLLSAFIVVKVGLIATACAAVTALVLYDHLQNKEIGKYINNKFDEAADYTINFITSQVEKLIPQQSRQV